MSSATVRKFKATVNPGGSSDVNFEPVEIDLFNASGVALATPTQMPLQADTVAADLAALKVDFNALLTKLKNAGLMASA